MNNNPFESNGKREPRTDARFTRNTANPSNQQSPKGIISMIIIVLVVIYRLVASGVLSDIAEDAKKNDPVVIEEPIQIPVIPEIEFSDFDIENITIE